ncbi:kinase-like domain-containing protein [Kalaharituber pfeilii]|nr:kinase-like domain-containing protein [Kalaharituber pfeilii]
MALHFPHVTPIDAIPYRTLLPSISLFFSCLDTHLNHPIRAVKGRALDVLFQLFLAVCQPFQSEIHDMSLIPYSPQDRESREVVLRHQSTLVLYDPKLGQLALRDLSPASRAIDTFSVCPYCHRPISDGHENPADIPPGVNHVADPGFVDRDYFRMLEASAGLPIPGPALSSQRAPPSPTRRRLPHPVSIDDIGDHHEPDPQEHSSPQQSSTGGISSAAFSPGYFERFFVSEGELGRGGKGVVLLVRHVLDGVSLGHFACKRVPVGDNHNWLAKVLTEVQLLQQLSHTNLVSYRHVWLESVKITNFGPSVPCAFILQQYCNAGDLHKYILKPLNSGSGNRKEDLRDRMRRRSRGQPELPTTNYRKIPFEHIISFFRDIASGLNHLHSNGFIHRDLKPSNCLLTDSGGSGQLPRVLVSDFGEVQMENAMRSSTGATGTISYCAPEVLQRVAPGGAFGNFTTKSDIFSLGMILYFMCFGNLPYECADSLNEENEDLDKLRAEISAWKGMVDRERLRPDLPEKLYLSLERLVSPNPTQRPSAEEILFGLNLGIGEDSSLGKRPVGSQSKTEDESSSSPRSYSTFNDSVKNTNATSVIPNRSSKLRELPMSPENLTAAAGEGKSTSTSMATTTAFSTNDTGSNVDSSLILRPRIDSQTLRLSELPRVLPPLTRRARILATLRSAEYIYFLRVFVFLLKSVAILQPCSPLAPNPWLLYPLLGLAALDFAGVNIRMSIMLMILHLGILYFAIAFGTMCFY